MNHCVNISTSVGGTTNTEISRAARALAPCSSSSTRPQTWRSLYPYHHSPSQTSKFLCKETRGRYKRSCNVPVSNLLRVQPTNTSRSAAMSSRASGCAARRLTCIVRSSLEDTPGANNETLGNLDDIDRRLEAIKKAGASKRRKVSSLDEEEKDKKSEPVTILDYADEKVFFDGAPSRGDLAVNILLGATLLWLPLTFASIGRAAWLRYRITDKRISVISTSPLESTLLSLKLPHL